MRRKLGEGDKFLVAREWLIDLDAGRAVQPDAEIARRARTSTTTVSRVRRAVMDAGFPFLPPGVVDRPHGGARK
jgi:hypothetical protein